MTARNASLPRVLCVDDEPKVLDGLVRALRGTFDVHTAVGGALGLAAIEREGPFAVVMSDMRMPGMDGATFLRFCRERAPDAVRVLLTGQADLPSAVAAVNEGQIFRFLTKPCDRGTLVAALGEAVDRYRDTARRARDTKALAQRNAQLLADVQMAEHVGEEFLDNVSHEMRTPLGVIMGYADLLEMGAGGGLNPDQERLVSRLRSQSRHLLQLIEDTLHARALRSSQSPPACLEPMSIDELSALLVRSAEDLPRSPGVTFHLNAAADRGGSIQTDPVKLALVVRSLLANAFKFTARGTVTMTITVDHSMLVFEIADTGIGIEPAQQATIFDLFSQGDTSPTRQFGGLGLGLYLVQGIVHQLGGRVQVDSAPGRGSTFRVEFPGYRAADSRAAAARPC